MGQSLTAPRLSVASCDGDAAHLRAVPADRSRVYSYHADGQAQRLTFSLSARGGIDSESYSLLDVMNDDRLKHFSFAARTEILNSFAGDSKARSNHTFRRELQSGCAPSVAVRDAGATENVELINLASNDYLNLSQHPRVRGAEKIHCRRFWA